MEFILVNKNVTIVASNFNISVFRESWFEKEGIILPEDIEIEKSAFTPSVVQVSTKKFVLTIVQNQMVFVINDESDEHTLKVISKLINALPHTPYTAIGVNFVYQILDDSGSLSRNMFFNEKLNLFNAFNDNSENPRFGAYLSKDFCESRLKLDIKPTNVKEDSMTKLEMRFNFNFHKDLSEKECVSEMLSHLDNWNKLYGKSVELMNSL